MEKFAIDLDRILDEFELQEDEEHLECQPRNHSSDLVISQQPSLDSSRLKTESSGIALLNHSESAQANHIQAREEIDNQINKGELAGNNTVPEPITLINEDVASLNDIQNTELPKGKGTSSEEVAIVQDLLSFTESPLQNSISFLSNLPISNLDLLTGINIGLGSEAVISEPESTCSLLPVSVLNDHSAWGSELPQFNETQKIVVSFDQSVNQNVCCLDIVKTSGMSASVSVEDRKGVESFGEPVCTFSELESVSVPEPEARSVRFGDFVPDVTEEDLEDLLEELEHKELCSGQAEREQLPAVSQIAEKIFTLDKSLSGDEHTSLDLTGLESEREMLKDEANSDQTALGRIQQAERSFGPENPELEEATSQSQDNKLLSTLDLVPSHSAPGGSASEQGIQMEGGPSSAPVVLKRQVSEPDIIGGSEIAMQPDIVDVVDNEPDLMQSVEPVQSVMRSNSPRPCDLVLTDHSDAVIGSPGATPHSTVDSQFFVDEPTPTLEDGGLSIPSEATTAPFPEPYTSLTEEDRSLGIIKPFWIPDEDALSCMHCETRFTLIRRRHHCRACGKVFCSICCNMRSKIEYLESREERVCQPCFATLSKVEAYKRYASPSSPSLSNGSIEERRPNPNNPAEYCSTIPPLQQASSSRIPPTVMVPIGVLKREGSSTKPRTEQKQVMFSDGIRPGGDLTSLDDGQQTAVRPTKRLAKAKKSSANSVSKSNRSDLPTCFLPKSDDGLPPILVEGDQSTMPDMRFEERIDMDVLIMRLTEENEPPVRFALNRNLVISVKIVTLDCCVNKTCWCFTTQGLRTVGQDEMMVLLEALPGETTIPRDVFVHLNDVYIQATKGHVLHEMNYTAFDKPFLGSRDISGLLYVRPTFQCVKKLHLPATPYLFCLLIQRTEMPWAKVFPLRLMLRLGAEFRYYPCPMYSSRERTPVFREVGNTIVNLLADLRNFSYTLPVIKGMTIHIEDKQTIVSIPRRHHSQLVRAIGESDQNVLAFGVSFNNKADSHLVCIQQPEGSYQTQAINIHNRPRAATGANFIVFNGALKTDSNVTGKSSIVEDGVMVQILPDTMVALRKALKETKDFQISCGPVGENESHEEVSLRWSEEPNQVNCGILSPIDSRPLSGIPSVRVYSGVELQCGNKAVRWNELYFIKLSPVQPNQKSEGVLRPEELPELSKSCELVATAACTALATHLDALKHLSPIAVRVVLESERAEYEAGSCGDRLPSTYNNDLDVCLIPVMLNESSKFTNGPCIVELWFYVVDKL